MNTMKMSVNELFISFIDEILKKENISNRQLCKRIDLAPSQLSGIRTTRTDLTLNIIEKVGEHYPDIYPYIFNLKEKTKEDEETKNEIDELKTKIDILEKMIDKAYTKIQQMKTDKKL